MIDPQLRAQLTTTFQQAFQRVPEDEEEFIAFLLAGYLMSPKQGEFLNTCMGYSALISSGVLGEEVVRSNMTLQTCLRIFRKAVTIVETLGKMSTLQAEVERLIKEEPWGNA